jgi:hypothetical protein
MGAAGSVFTFNGAVASTLPTNGTIYVSGGGGIGVTGQISTATLTATGTASVAGALSVGTGGTSTSTSTLNLNVGTNAGGNDQAANIYLARNGSAQWGIGLNDINNAQPGITFQLPGSGGQKVAWLINGVEKMKFDQNSLLTTVGAITMSGTLTGASTFATAATFSSTLGVTGAFTPSQTAGIVGTTTNNSVNAGGVGEYTSSLVALGSAVSLTTATAANVTTISLTAGDWDVEANVNFNDAAATVTVTTAGISTTTATLPTDGSEAYSGVLLVTGTAKDSITLPRKRISISGTTTVYLVASQTFSLGTASAYGAITARRVR